MGTGPPGVGVLQTSGTVAVEMPLLPLWQSERPLMLIVTDIGRLSASSRGEERGAALAYVGAGPEQGIGARGVVFAVGRGREGDEEWARGRAYISPAVGRGL